MRLLLLRLLGVLFITSFFSVVLWHFLSNSAAGLHGPRYSERKAAGPIKPTTSRAVKDNAIIDRLLKSYSPRWKRREANFSKFRSLLSSSCHAVSKAVVTQSNTPVGSKVVYDGEKTKPLQVTKALFSTFAKEQPFGNASWDTCAVVGNGGILVNSSCAEKINSANLVIRCNLPPLGNGYEKDVGNKTSLVTANPSILIEKFSGLMERRRPFVESLRPYGDSLLLLPAFSYSHNTPVSLRALYALEDFNAVGPRPVFFNPEYLSSLARFWRGRGLRTARLSTGLIVTSLALELCTNVHLYGFWPFSLHPHGRQTITNHYYDNRQSKKNVHSMPSEFEHLLRLHVSGVIQLHLGECSTTDLNHTEKT
ncbi:alpha-2,8-sialyltransferase 8F-like [Astyanax mexicanus]|uniref:ST8 alpha-N-acetyl-neuraminide alpha-2,8-sialyltransferase 6 n=2 Tax=Astyanax mexicanus TaxID=7994 RepID=A0A3B1IF97_ASTMX|nr:alpha-2,8-sialyltransferase 8F-like [Astyanax mexicanus]